MLRSNTMKRIALIMLFLPMSAYAADPPRTIDMTTVLVTDRGGPMKDPSDRTEEDKECAKCGFLTVGHAIAAALGGSYEDEKALSFQQRFDRAALAKEIKDNKAATLTAPEIALIEKLIAKAGFFPSAVYQIGPLLDPNIKAGEVQ